MGATDWDQKPWGGLADPCGSLGAALSGPAPSWQQKCHPWDTLSYSWGSLKLRKGSSLAFRCAHNKPRKKKRRWQEGISNSQALACLLCLRIHLLECLWTRKRAQLNGRLKEKSVQLQKRVYKHWSDLSPKRHNQTMLGAWKTSECAKWTIRKHNTYSEDVDGTEVRGRLHREITGNDRWRSYWTHTWRDANHNPWCFCDKDFNPVDNGLGPLAHIPWLYPWVLMDCSPGDGRVVSPHGPGAAEPPSVVSVSSWGHPTHLCCTFGSVCDLYLCPRAYGNFKGDHNLWVNLQWNSFFMCSDHFHMWLQDRKVKLTELPWKD